LTIEKEMKYLFALSLLVVKLIPGTISFTEAQAPVATVKGGTVKNGIATISGTYTCAENFDDGYVDVSVNQKVGRTKTVNGGDSNYGLTCNGDAQSWSLIVNPYNGKFAGGKAFVSLSYGFWDNDDPYDSVYGSSQQSVQLKGGSGRRI
jgi:hypothetical protein